MKQRVFVGLSGGVDSSVAAKRLIERGFDVVGVFIKTWFPDFIQCNMEAERLDAMRAAAHLGIPFLTCDAEEAYKREVAEYMISEYAEGHTPNPDVMCNRAVKFGVFKKFAEAHGVSHIATGHYAQVHESNGKYELFRGIDADKDQSYFLWTLRQDELATILFPIGDSRKEIIRAEASRAKLPTFAKKDSQGICFLGKIDMQEFLSHYHKPAIGDVLDVSGKKIGTHPGALFFTNGQRHGFTLNTQQNTQQPLYVIHKNVEENTITVAPERLLIQKTEKVLLTNVVLRTTDVSEITEIQYRYRQKPIRAEVIQKGLTSALLRVLDENVELPSIGQSCVFYNNNRCLGGGIINDIHENI